MITIDGPLATVQFERFDLASYELFLRTKTLPGPQIAFDWQADRYTLTTPARFSDRLGVAAPVPITATLPGGKHLRDYQAWAVDLALPAQRFAIWLDTGLGKTACYLDWARRVRAATKGKVLILSPQMIFPQTREMYDDFYSGAALPQILPTREAMIAWLLDADAENGIALCNYEKFIPGVIPELRHLAGLIADESSILKTGGGVIKWNLIKSARGIEYKLSCTATPAPNDAMEYASQAAFLEKIKTEGEVLWTYFSKDKFGNWSIKAHARAAFYAFMASWSLYLRDPAVFGFADILSTLPPPIVTEERIPLTDEQRVLMSAYLVERKRGMFADEQLGIKERAKLAQIARGFVYAGTGKSRTVRRVDSLKARRVVELIREEIAAGRQVIVWTTFDEEAAVILDEFGPQIGGVAELSGKQSDAARAELLADFRAGGIDCLISKPQLIGYGLNLQFVKTMIFSGLDDSFERAYQAIRRAYRFGQTDPVRVFWPYVPELEGLVFSNIRQKEARFLEEVAAQERLYRRALADQLPAGSEVAA